MGCPFPPLQNYPFPFSPFAQKTAECSYTLQWAPLSPKIAPSHGGSGLPSNTIPWAHPSPQPKQHVDRFSHFCPNERRVPLYVTIGRPIPTENCPFPWGIWTPSNTWFPEPTWVLNANSISISSAIFAELTSLTDRPTDRPTDHATRSVTIDRIYVCSTGELVRITWSTFRPHRRCGLKWVTWSWPQLGCMHGTHLIFEMYIRGLFNKFQDSFVISQHTFPAVQYLPSAQQIAWSLQYRNLYQYYVKISGHAASLHHQCSQTWFHQEILSEVQTGGNHLVSDLDCMEDVKVPPNPCQRFSVWLDEKAL